ncbi:MAG: Crp/Fnr family transcriptional regulator [Chloroflexi bacterium]|nr:Crp/Fnr family transcriptional regulator [Chloroflexota bacterium]
MTTPRLDLEVACAAMARSPLFHGIGGDELTRIAQTMTRRRFRRDEVIFHEGDPGDSLHVVVEGRVKITRESAEGDEAIVVILAPGDSFGELVLLDGAPRSATATAMEPSVTMTMARATFVELVESGSPFRAQLLIGIARRIRRLTDQLAEVHFLDLAGRLALQLTRLAEESGPGRTADITLGTTLTQSDLAAMVGGTRQRVNQIIGDFADEGLISNDGGHIVIHDLERLRSRANW